MFARDIKISKYATINKEGRYENNYLSKEKGSISAYNFLNFFFKNIFYPKKKKKFEFTNLSKQIYERKKSLLTWGGHSTFLFQNQSVNVFIDPHFTLRASPFSFVGPKRYMPSVFNKNNLPKMM